MVLCSINACSVVEILKMWWGHSNHLMQKNFFEFFALTSGGDANTLGTTARVIIVELSQHSILIFTFQHFTKNRLLRLWLF